ncbi:MAG: zinc finger domain-containing protein [Bacillota bacterium]
MWQPGWIRDCAEQKTVDSPCPACGSLIKKAAFLGGSIYFCEQCQPL